MRTGSRGGRKGRIERGREEREDRAGHLLSDRVWRTRRWLMVDCDRARSAADLCHRCFVHVRYLRIEPCAFTVGGDYKRDSSRDTGRVAGSTHPSSTRRSTASINEKERRVDKRQSHHPSDVRLPAGRHMQPQSSMHLAPLPYSFAARILSLTGRPGLYANNTRQQSIPQSTQHLTRLQTYQEVNVKLLSTFCANCSSLPSIRSNLCNNRTTTYPASVRANC